MDRREMIAGSLAMTGFGTVSQASQPTPFYVPAEEHRHERTFMQWPVSRRVYRDPVFLKMAQQTIADIANTISEFEPVTMLANSRYHAQAKRMLSDRVTLWNIATEDLWCRDAGPIFGVNDDGIMSVRHIQFNGWGRKQVHKHDGRIAKAVAKRLKLPLFSAGLNGEAGAVEQDGHGLLMAHKSSWLNDNRNPNMSLSEIEEGLFYAYGADRIVWADGVMGEDITDYHIDSLARFTGKGRVLINLPDDPDMSDPFHAAAYETYDALKAAELDVKVIPEPRIRRVKSVDFVASYANYYVCNGAVIAAEFGDPETDKIARDALQRHYPDREVVTLNVDPLGELGGGIHCATQQMPAL